MDDVSQNKGKDNANNVQTEIRFVYKVTAETCHDNVDDQNDAINQKQVVLLVVSWKELSKSN